MAQIEWHKKKISGKNKRNHSHTFLPLILIFNMHINPFDEIFIILVTAICIFINNLSSDSWPVTILSDLFFSQ
jgi:hypothetical protein